MNLFTLIYELSWPKGAKYAVQQRSGRIVWFSELPGHEVINKRPIWIGPPGSCVNVSLSIFPQCPDWEYHFVTKSAYEKHKISDQMILTANSDRLGICKDAAYRVIHKDPGNSVVIANDLGDRVLTNVTDNDLWASTE